MGTDNIFEKTKARNAALQPRARARRAQHERVLIVCEGEKTEPSYFKGLRKEFAINAVNVVIADKKRGLDPIEPRRIRT